MKYYDKKEGKVKPIKWAFVIVAVLLYLAFVGFCFWWGAL
jgi:flagellar biogenesis protein FliO